MERSYPIKVSIALATCTQTTHLVRALDSVLRQQHAYSFEIVISNNNDDIRDIILDYQKKYPALIRSFFYDQQQDAYRNFLRTLRLCDGEYIATLDANDYWTDPKKLEKQITFLDNYPEFALSCHRFKYLFEDTKQLSNDFISPELFKETFEGVSFDAEQYFEHNLVRTLAVVFRNSALQNTQYLDTYQYCSDAQVFWTIVAKGKGYLHNFFGGIYTIPVKENWNDGDRFKHTLTSFLQVNELLTHNPENEHLKKTVKLYEHKIEFSKTKNKSLLNLAAVKDKNFTIVSDDGWGAELYKAFNLDPLTPFIGVFIDNESFIEMASNLVHYLSLPLQFINHVPRRKLSNSSGVSTHYPVAQLGENVILHFYDYVSEDEASERWNERLPLINWDNLYLKMNLEPDEVNVKNINSIKQVSSPYRNKICFVNSYALPSDLEWPSSHFIMMENWNSKSELHFSLSLLSFDIMAWLNGENDSLMKDYQFSSQIFNSREKNNDPYFLRYDHQFFVQFDHQSVYLLDSYFPRTITVAFNDEIGCASIQYNKTGLDHFRLSVKDRLPAEDLTYVKLFVDLSNCENRHVFILARGIKEHKLRVDFVPVAENGYNYDGMHLNVNGSEQDIPEEFEWMHFDLSIAGEEETNDWFEKIKSFCFYVNPGDDAKGVLDIYAIFIGSIAKFEETLKKV